MAREAITSCRLCPGRCALQLTLDDDDRIVTVRGHRADPLTRGFTCIKGLNAPAVHYSPERILHPLERQPDGTWREVSLDHALDAIAARLGQLIADHGPDSVGCFKGTLNYNNFLANAMLPAFMAAIGSKAFYSTMTIDQSGKWVTVGRLGAWAAPRDDFASADVSLLVGSNPFVSLSNFGIKAHDPIKTMRDAKARGLQLIVVDPRASETARQADITLQPLPGEDATLFAGFIRVVLENGWHDEAFCDAYVKDLAALRRAVAPFTPELVARRTGVAPGDLVRAAELFAAPLVENGQSRRKRGVASSGTGPSMGPHSNLAEHLIECLNVICGRFAREGDPVPNPGVLGAPRARRAEVIAPTRPWEQGPRDVLGHGMIFGERMTATLPDQILHDGPERVRALIVDGGNPAAAIPDTRRTREALARLDLLVAIEPFMGATAELAHYIIPPRLMFERIDAMSRDYEPFTLFEPYSHFTPPVIAPPAGSETIEDWAALWEIARRMGRQIVLDGEPMDMVTRPDSEALMAFMLRNSNVPYEQIRAATGGKVFDVPPVRVEPAAGAARFDVAPADVCAELDAVLGEGPGAAGYPHRLAVRRLREVVNTSLHKVPAIAQRMPTNFAYLNPADMAALALANGDVAAISSPHGAIEAVVQADATVREGVVSISHGWGGGGDAGGRHPGVNVNRLISLAGKLDPINAMPVMTGFPVRVEKRQAPAAVPA